MSNTGNCNTGNWNTGNWNTGNWNTGNWNTGNWNTGDRNTGNWNTGYSNTGDRNTGNWNTGYSNTGNWNTGDRNTGDRNTGYSNTGNCNTGNWNTGNCNTGNCNTGNWNTGNWNTGFFCTETPSPVFFDKPWTGGTLDAARNLIPFVELPIGVKWTPADKMTDDEKAEYPNHVNIGGFIAPYNRTIQQAFPMAWAKMDEETKQRFLNLPNFDADKFLKCTGVDVRQPVTVTIGSETVTVSSDKAKELLAALRARKEAQK